MSGVMKPSPVAEASAVEFGTTVDKFAYEQPFTAVAAKETSSHIALKVRFSDPDLYAKYIAGTSIPCSQLQENGQTVYEAYLSFGPTGSGFMSEDSALGEYWADALSSGVLTPAARTSKKTGYDVHIGPQPKASFNLRALGNLLPRTKKIHPQTIIQINKGASREEILALQEFNADLLNARTAYESKVRSSNPFSDALKLLSGDKTDPLETYLRAGKAAILKLQENLGTEYPEIKGKDINTFVRWLENEHGVTFGLPPLEVATVKYLDPKETDNHIDPKVEHVLEFMRLLHDNKQNVPYLFPNLNCADIVKAALTYKQDRPNFVDNFTPSFESKFFGFVPYLATLGQFGLHMTSPTEIERDTKDWAKERDEQYARLTKLDISSPLIPPKPAPAKRKELQPRLSIPKPGSGLHMAMHHMKYSTDIPNHIADAGMAVKTIFDDPNKAQFLVYPNKISDNVNTEFAILDIDKVKGTIDIKFTVPVTADQAKSLLRAIQKDMPDNIVEVNISAHQDQEKQEAMLASLVRKTLGKGVSVKVEVEPAVEQSSGRKLDL